ncbi:MAG TPA: DMT family transporter [Burkholderiaceae bacterium]
MSAKASPWMAYTLTTTLLWGLWGALTGVPAEHGFPETLTYVVWALTMIAPAAWAMHKAGWKLKRDGRSLKLGLAIGLLGAGGQMILFKAVTLGPTYLIFPIVSLSPAITILLSFFFLSERTGRLGMAGIAIAVLSLPLFDYTPGKDATHYGTWFVLSLAVMIAWGLQSYYIKLANATMDAESIFFYMMLTGLMFIPAALWMTDFSAPIELGFSGPYLAAAIQLLNAVGALTLVYAFRYGKAIVVSPLVNAGAPLLTSVISLSLSQSWPGSYKIAGIVLALSAALLLALQPE